MSDQSKTNRIYLFTGPLDTENFRGLYEFLYANIHTPLDVDDSPIEIHIDSDGGDASYPLIINSLINSTKQRPEIHTYNIGVCQSAATSLFLVGDKRFAYDGSYFMVHNIKTSFSSESNNSIKNMYAVSENIERNTFNFILEKTKIKRNELKKIFNSNSMYYYDAKQALTLDICTKILK